jgi:hypothetical protein
MAIAMPIEDGRQELGQSIFTDVIVEFRVGHHENLIG